MLKAVFIFALGSDSSTNDPVVTLKEIHGEKTLHISIGFLEDQAITSQMHGIKFPRPMTHDLFKNIMESLDVNVRDVEIRELNNDKLHALINLNYHGKEISLDSKISDALALALRVNAPIYVEEEVFRKAAQIRLIKEPADKSEQGKDWKDILEDLSPEAFGKYKM
jgi:bifunctional DNase/RNase